MNIPNKLNLLGYSYKIVEAKNNLRDENRSGWHNSNTNEIGIDPDQNDECKFSTLIHEIIEGINYHLELRMDHNQISALETGLFQVIKDNNLRWGQNE